MHVLLVGIEHLMTGITLKSDGCLRFERESPSIVRVISNSKIEAFWQVTQHFTESTEQDVNFEEYSTGEAEWYAQVVGPRLVQIDDRSAIDMQTYTRRADFTDSGGNATRYAPNEPCPFPWAVVKAMRRKHGAKADGYLSDLRWDRDHWYYCADRMYIGVEPDGYIHT